MDNISKKQRSFNMSRIPSKDTQPELKLRKYLHSLGYRYRLNEKYLPGKPDIVFKTKKKVIFVHGCFWHRHQNCKFCTTPKTNISFWKEKFKKNVTRDELVYNELSLLGWSYFISWECMIKKMEPIFLKELTKFLK